MIVVMLRTFSSTEALFLEVFVHDSMVVISFQHIDSEHFKIRFHFMCKLVCEFFVIVGYRVLHGLKVRRNLIQKCLGYNSP